MTLTVALGATAPVLADCVYEPPAPKGPRLQPGDRIDESRRPTVIDQSRTGLQERSANSNIAAILGARNDQITNRQDPISAIVQPNQRVSEPVRPGFRMPQLPSVAAVWQPLNYQTEVFAIDPQGALKVVWKHDGYPGEQAGFWEAAEYISGNRLTVAGAPLAAVWQPMNEQLEVFTLAKNGALFVAYKAHSREWHDPIAITPPNFASVCSHVAAVFQPLNNQLEVFAIDATGAVRVAYKAQNGTWHAPITLTLAGVAPPGAPLTVVWQPLNEQLELFWIDGNGAMRQMLKAHNQQWLPPRVITPAGYASPHSKIASVWQPLNEQLEVFVIDQRGAVKGLWKAHNGAWLNPFVVIGSGAARPGAALSAIWNPDRQMLSVATVGMDGRVLNAFKTNNGNWSPGSASSPQLHASAPGVAPAGAPLAAIYNPVDIPVTWDNRRGGGGTEVFVLDDDQSMRVTGNRQSGVPKITRPNFAPIYGARTAYCSNVLRRWSAGYDGDVEPDVPGLAGAKGNLEQCEQHMGVIQYCERQGKIVMVAGVPQSEHARMFVCSDRYHADNAIEQAQRIIKGVAEGSKDAMWAAVIYSPYIVQGYGCVQGAVFACATLAVSIASRLVPIPPEVKDALDLANDAQACASEDILACARLGAAGARAVGVQIPGQDAELVTQLTTECLAENFASCLHLGEIGASAAGVPVGQLNQAARNARQCYDGDTNACIALGQQAAKAGIPIGGVVNNASMLNQCSQQSISDCLLIGQALANIPR